ncbi:hypothetical protein HanPSC8_Chr03g0119481 [Helianthus annuus]|nr:hypothetical protein HanPSC8_Chr03g0119481 [Helianthus annuus]
MSGLVIVKYWRAPTMDRVASENKSPVETKETLVLKGVGAGFASNILARVKISKVYLDWFKKDHDACR